MQILVIATQPFFIERGTPIAVRELVVTLCGLGHRVDLLTTHLGEDVEVAGLTIIRADAFTFVREIPIGLSLAKLIASLGVSIKLATLLREREYDVIHAVEDAIFPALLAKKLTNTSLVYDMDSLMSSQLAEKSRALRPIASIVRYFEKKAVRAADLILPVCDAISQTVRAWTNGPIHVLPDIAPPPPSSRTGQPSIRKSDRPLCLYVGNLDHYQGIDLLLDALALLPAAEKPQVKIIGGTESQIAKYREYARSRSLSQDVEYLGPRPLQDLMDYLVQADILVSPRIKGVNTPMKLYAYMASAVPIVATRILSHTQVIDDQTAFLAEPVPRAFSQALLDCVRAPIERARRGKEAAQIAHDRYGKDAFEARLEAAYAKISPKNA